MNDQAKLAARAACYAEPVAETLLQLISRRVVVSLDLKSGLGFYEEIDGAPVRNCRGQKAEAPHLITLFKAGFIDVFCCLTKEGRDFGVRLAAT